MSTGILGWPGVGVNDATGGATGRPGRLAPPLITP